MASLLSLTAYILLLLCFLHVSTIKAKRSETLLSTESEKFQALYVFGDSLVDSGNNNNLNTLAKANFLPYGVDFEGGKPTGRFCNGKTIADFVAINYGLPLAPPYLGLSDAQRKNISTGINYASASCGVFPDAGKKEGICLPLSNQTELFKRTVNMDLPNIFKTKEELRRHLAESLFMTAVGVNDYNEVYNATQTDPNTFADQLLNAFLAEVEKLIDLGARKFFINNVKPLGCYPNIVAVTKPRGSCNEQLNRDISLYNIKLKQKLNGFRRKHPGTSFIYSDYFRFVLLQRGTMRNPRNSRLLNTVNPCCPPMYNGTGSCFASDRNRECPSRDMHMFFDPFHPTENTNFNFAIHCFREGIICQYLKG